MTSLPRNAAAVKLLVCEELSHQTGLLPALADTFNELLHTYEAVVAGGFCVRAACSALSKVEGAATSSNASRNDASQTPYPAPVDAALPTCSDLDIWVPLHHEQVFVRKLRSIFKHKVLMRMSYIALKSNYGRFSDCVQRLWRVKLRVNGFYKEIQIMCCSDLTKALSTFDIDICTVLWDGRQVFAPAPIWEQLLQRKMCVSPSVIQGQSVSEFHRTLRRIKKYIDRGFELSARSYQQLHDRSRELADRSVLDLHMDRQQGGSRRDEESSHECRLIQSPLETDPRLETEDAHPRSEVTCRESEGSKSSDC